MATISADQFAEIRGEGYKEGYQDSIASVLDWLEHSYLSPTLEDPQSEEGAAILKLAGKLASAMREPDFGKKRKKH